MSIIRFNEIYLPRKDVTYIATLYVYVLKQRFNRYRIQKMEPHCLYEDL